MRISILILLIMIIAFSCRPAVSVRYDSRDALLSGTAWNFVSSDTFYFQNGNPVYVGRQAKDTCSEVLIFNPAHDLVERDSCGTGAAGVLHGTWGWRENDSLRIQFGGQIANQMGVRYTGDTLQLTYLGQSDIGTQPQVITYPVRTFVKLP